jgi:pimeloyl-ACP methyl ester carboxylesterase
MRARIAALVLAAAALPAATLATQTPPLHVGSIYASKIGDGPIPLVLVPGLGCGPWVWDGFVKSLPQGQYTVYEVTLAGFDGAPPVPGPKRFDGWVQSVANLITAQHVAHPIVIGHSLGGSLAVRLAETQPTLPRALVLVDSLPLFPPLPPGASMDERRTQMQQLSDRMSAMTQEQFAKGEHDGIARMVTDPATADMVTQKLLAGDRDTIVQSAVELGTTDMRPDLGKITAPALLLAESYPSQPDEQTKTFYAAQYDGMKNLTVQVVPNARHFIMLDQPAAFQSSVMAFLTSLK